MSDSFAILARFLQQFDLEVEGRSEEEPPEEIRTLLRRFAEGDLNLAERESLVCQLRDQPQWVKFLAREVKAQRPSPDSQ